YEIAPHWLTTGRHCSSSLENACFLRFFDQLPLGHAGSTERRCPAVGSAYLRFGPESAAKLSVGQESSDTPVNTLLRWSGDSSIGGALLKRRMLHDLAAGCVENVESAVLAAGADDLCLSGCGHAK